MGNAPFRTQLEQWKLLSPEAKFEQWHRLPRDVKCHIASMVTDVADVLALGQAVEGTSNETMLFECIRRIEAHPSDPETMIPANLVLAMPNLESCTAPIVVDDPVRLDQLAQTRLRFFDIVVGSRLSTGYEPVDIANFLGTIHEFIASLLAVNQPMLQLEFVFSRQFEAQAGTMSVLKGSMKYGRLHFEYDQGRVIILSYMLNMEGGIRDILFDTLKMMDRRRALVALEMHQDYFISLTSGLMNQAEITDFNTFVASLKGLTQFGLYAIFADQIIYYSLLHNASSTINRLYYAHPSKYETTLMVSMVPKTMAKYGQIALQYLSVHPPSQKQVYIDLPLAPESLPLVMQIFPQVQRVSVLDELLPGNKVTQIENILTQYPVQLTIFSRDPAVYEPFLHQYGERLTLEKII